MLKKTYQRIGKTLIFSSITITILLLINSVFINNLITANQISQPETINAVKARLDKTYNYTELIVWEHNHVNFTTDSFERSSDPLKIIDSGKGRCGEFAILYAALCKSQGYDCRIVVSTFRDHEWTQVKVSDQWIHVDPSLGVNDPRISDPLIYERDWNSPPILALAFDNNSIVDVTSTYRQGFWVNIFSIECFSYMTFLVFIIVMILTHLWTREFFYGLYFRKHNGLLEKIASIYQRILRTVYLIRFLLLFFLPLAISVIIAPLLNFTANQNLFLSCFVMGLALVTFFVGVLPSLTQPHVFISVIEDCTDSPNCKLAKKIGNNSCEFQEGVSCKIKEDEVFLTKGIPKTIFFRFQNLSFHTLKNCVIWITFPRVFYVHDISEKTDFFKNYEIQKRNNAIKVTSTNNCLSMSPSDCIIIPVKVVLTEIPQKKEPLQIQFFSETTSGTDFYDFPIRYIDSQAS